MRELFTGRGENGISVIAITTIPSKLRQSYKSNSNLCKNDLNNQENARTFNNYSVSPSF